MTGALPMGGQAITNASTITATGNINGGAFVPTGSGVPANGVYLPAANTVGFSTNTTKWGSVNSTGNWVFVAPSSGTPVTVNSTVTDTVTLNSTSASGALSRFQNSAVDIGYVGSPKATIRGGLALGDFSIASNTGQLILGTNAKESITISANQNVTIAAPSSGVAFTVTGVGGTTRPVQVNAAASALMAAFDSTDANGGYFTLTNSTVVAAYIGTGANVSAGVTLGDLVLAAGTSARATQIVRGGGNGVALTVAGTGAVTIAAPSGGTALTVTGLTGTNPLIVNGAGSTSASQTLIYEPLFSAAATKPAATTDTGTFTGTITGCTTAPTGTFTWSRVGNQVTIETPNLTATSNATTLTFTGLPAALQPARTQVMAATNLENNTVLGVSGSFSVSLGSGIITCARGVVTGSDVVTTTTSFTNSGTKGIGNNNFTYNLT
jgi:hypothetical protein